MGDMTRQEMVDEARLSLENRDTADISDAEIEEWLDWTLKHVTDPSNHMHRELFELDTSLTFATDDFDYTLPSGTIFVYSVFNQDQGYRLRPMSQRQVDSRRRTTGQPRSYSIFGNTLDVQPTPTSTYNGDVIGIRRYREVTSLAAVGSTTEISAVWDEVLVLGTIWRGWIRLGRREQAEFAKDDFAQMMADRADRLRLDHFDQGFRQEMTPEFAVYQRRF